MFAAVQHGTDDGRPYGVVIERPPAGHHAFPADPARCALAMWCLILGVTGLFLHCLSDHSALGRYLCDSSYFLHIDTTASGNGAHIDCTTRR